MNEATRRMVRTAVQLVAAGGLTELVRLVAGDMPAAYAPYLFVGSTLAVTFAQNYAEDAGWVRPLLKRAP